MQPLAVIGHLARDVVDGGEPRIGGAPWYAGRALRILGQQSRIAAKCGETDRRPFLNKLAPLGIPVHLVCGGSTTEFAIDYRGEERHMTVGSVGEPWTPDEAEEAVGRAEWVQVAPLLRSDFPVETLAALARGRRLLVDAQGLVRVPQTGPLQFDTNFDRAMLEHISILKLAEEEAIALTGDVEDVASLDVPEIVVTRGTQGCTVYSRGRRETIPARPLEDVADPTGAGDAFAAGYIAARAAGHRPASAARRATALVAGLLAAVAAP
jgi:sugar/nucleoside kinase (ribokinase family)